MRKASVELPIVRKIPDFLKLLEDNKVIIVSAETGVGKSTMLPSAAFKTGKYDNIVITVPTRIAAATLAERVSQQCGSPLGEIVGYQTGFEKKVSSRTKIRYETDGFELIKEIHSKDTTNGKGFLLFIDEIQEWSTTLEALVAWVKEKLKSGWEAKVVLMSATCEMEKLSVYFDNCPVLKVDGRGYPVKEVIRTSADFTRSIVEMAEAGHDTLAFVPGKREIIETATEVKKMLKARGMNNIRVLSIHGEMTTEDQQEAFEDSESTKIVVSTNVCQTSVTIPGIEAVVDSGLERHNEVINGVETLTIGPIANSDYVQRKGRAGRTAPGTYVWCGECTIESLRKYPIPEILISTSGLTQIILKMADVDTFPINKLEFFHSPKAEDVEASKLTLRTLGAFDEENHITLTGRYMAAMPISARYGRMLVEAEKLGVLGDVVTIAAIMELGGLKRAQGSYSQITREAKSDLLSELDMFKYMQSQMERDTSSVSKELNLKTYYRVLDLRSKLYDVLPKIFGHDVTSTGNRNDIVKACCAGLVEYLYIKEDNSTWYVSANDEVKRKLDLFSSTLPTRYVIGIPKNISVKSEHTENGLQTLYILSCATSVTPDILKEVAPNLFKIITEYSYIPNKNEYWVITKTMFNGNTIDSVKERVTNDTLKRQIAIDWLTESTTSPVTILYNESVPEHLAATIKANHKVFGNDTNKTKYFYTNALQKVLGGTPNFAKAKNMGVIRA